MRSPVQEGTLLWTPTAQQQRQTNLTMFTSWLEEHKGVRFDTYDALWTWSVDHPEAFWEAIWHYFDIKSYTPYTQVLSESAMPGVRWFEGATLNFAEHVFREAISEAPALVFTNESGKDVQISWHELQTKTAQLVHFFKSLGVKKGDCIAAYIPNIPEAFIGFFAASSMGAIWSSCSPDFGTESVIERFSQIHPKVVLAVDGYTYGGKAFDRMDRVKQLCDSLQSVDHVLLIPYLDQHNTPLSAELRPKVHTWSQVMAQNVTTLKFEPVPFSHPLWVLYSSGTTGLPKPIVHGHGGMLLEHLKGMSFHKDVKKGDRFFWFTTTGWMMWNVVLAALLKGATALVYDGSPVYPDLNVLWKFAERTKMTHFGASATYFVNCMKEGLRPKDHFELSNLRNVGSTGSPLPPEGFAWIYEAVGAHLHLNSTSGGTDICSSFVGGNPNLPVYAGEIQCRCLGAKVEAFNELAEPVLDEVGEMVITAPLPCMPLYFMGDSDFKRYKESYFEHFPGIWRHGDWIKISRRGTAIIYGRSDATLNKMGVRIGTSEIYRAVELHPAVKDSLVLSLERKDGSWYMPLFIQVKEGYSLDDATINAIKQHIRERISPRFIPDEFIPVDDIPYTLSGKKMEKPIKRILTGVAIEKAISRDAMRNPSVVDFYVKFGKMRELEGAF